MTFSPMLAKIQRLKWTMLAQMRTNPNMTETTPTQIGIRTKMVEIQIMMTTTTTTMIISKYTKKPQIGAKNGNSTKIKSQHQSRSAY